MTLWRLYKREGIGYSLPNQKMWGDNVDLDRKQRRLKFILEMAEIIEKKTIVIWIDETTCNLWTNKGKVWQVK